METLRLAQGLPVYIAPNAVFNPHVYMPLYFWLGSWLLPITGARLIPLRLISLAATCATTVLIYWIARRETQNNWIALTSAGLFLGGYRINGFWYELVRVDSLLVMLIVGGLALGIYGRDCKTKLVLSAFVLALAFFTKQGGAFIGVGFGIYLLAVAGRRALGFLVPFGLFTVVPLFALNGLTDGWFFYHVFFIGSADPIEIGRIFNFMTGDLVGVMGGLVFMTLVAAFLMIRTHGLRGLFDESWLVAIVVGVLISGLGRARVGGNLNDRMPAYTLLCLAPALLFRTWEKTDTLRLNLFKVKPETVLAAAILVQFALGIYYPPRYIPTPEMYTSGASLIQRIAAIDGPVFVMMHPYYALLAGKATSTQMATLWYVRDRGAYPFPDDFVQRLQTKYYRVIISDESDFETEPALKELLAENYPSTELLPPADGPPTTTGVVVRPMVIYRPKP
jgi:4-amino-4-deoxy-L-arabinose transferase-like glycosyltransferase